MVYTQLDKDSLRDKGTSVWPCYIQLLHSFSMCNEDVSILVKSELKCFETAGLIWYFTLYRTRRMMLIVFYFLKSL